MTSGVPQPPAVPPSGDPEADARFAAYLADIAAHVDDPDSGEELRGFLNDDPEFQRAMFDLVEAHTAPPSPSRMQVCIAVVTFILAIAAVATLIEFLL
jgi:hypothetical protein